MSKIEGIENNIDRAWDNLAICKMPLYLTLFMVLSRYEYLRPCVGSQATHETSGKIADIVGRKSKKEKRGEILHLLQTGVTQGNCMGLVRKCDEISTPVARAKIIGFLRFMQYTATDLQRIEDTLFRRDVKTGKSLKEIRDDIAHGEISEHDFETVAALGHRLIDAQRISKEVILRSIMCAEELAHQLQTEKSGLE